MTGDDLDAAMAAAEAALPENWEIQVGFSVFRNGWYGFAARSMFQKDPPYDRALHTVEAPPYPDSYETALEATRALATALEAHG